jgi:hypothetical protein
MPLPTSTGPLDLTEERRDPEPPPTGDESKAA